MSEPHFHDVAGVDQIPDRKSLAVDVAGHAILICHTKGEFFAVENQCSHAMATLEGGRLRAYRLICPLHGASFDVRDGSVKGQPAFEPIRSYPVKIAGERILVGVTDE